MIAVAAITSIGVCLAGCNSPKRGAKYPPGTLLVRYEAATTYSTCLVASVAMAANYLFDDHRFSERGILADLHREGRDETRAGDLQAYLDGKGLHMVVLGNCQLDAKPPTGLRWWLEERGHPVICVINRDPAANPDFQHAVVVIGISANLRGAATDIIHYFDPSSPEALHSTEAPAFDVLWARCGRAMMIVTVPPAPPAGQAAASRESK